MTKTIINENYEDWHYLQVKQNLDKALEDVISFIEIDDTHFNSEYYFKVGDFLYINDATLGMITDSIIDSLDVHKYTFSTVEPFVAGTETIIHNSVPMNNIILVPDENNYSMISVANTYEDMIRTFKLTAKADLINLNIVNSTDTILTLSEELAVNDLILVDGTVETILTVTANDTNFDYTFTNQKIISSVDQINVPTISIAENLGTYQNVPLSQIIIDGIIYYESILFDNITDYLIELNSTNTSEIQVSKLSNMQGSLK